MVLSVSIMCALTSHLVSFTSILNIASSFNVDTQFSTLIWDPYKDISEDSLFGYTVAIQNKDRIIVGAPKSQSRLPQHYSVKRPGAVHSCSISSSTCFQMVLDPTGNDLRNDSYKYHDLKDEELLGLSLEVEHEGDGRLIACAPCWKNQYYKDFFILSGVCYLLNSNASTSTTAQKLIPLHDRSKYSQEVNGRVYFYYSYGEAGLAVHFTSDGKELLIGAPGVFHWSGSIIKYNLEAGGSPTIPNPSQIPEISINDYIGYTVSSGFFDKDRSKRLYVSGAPRAADYMGKVLLFEFEKDYLKIRFEQKGDSFGAYFGASLCVVDLNSDGLDDIIVGAPLYSGGIGDIGRVYVYMNEGNMILRETSAVITGSSIRDARFGSAISVIGDINMDGFPDIAIGAPYENNKGALYIYHSGHNGIQFVQRIEASDIDSSLRGFGISISKGVDIDSNGYPDFAVGAYESGTVIVLKSRPIIKFTSRVSVDNNTIAFENTPISHKMNICLKYSGASSPSTTDVVVKLILDETYKRLYFPNSGNKNNYTAILTLNADIETCQEVNFFTKVRTQINLNYLYYPVDVNFGYSIVNKTYTRFCKTCPVVDPSKPSSLSQKIPVTTCGDNKICIPDWRLSHTFIADSYPFVVGSEKTIGLHLTLANEGDSTYVRTLEIRLPPKISLRSTLSKCNNVKNTGVINCLEGEFLKSNEKIVLQLALNVENLEAGTKLQMFNISVGSYIEQNPTTNYTVALLLAAKGRLNIQGLAQPDLVIINTESLVRVNHTYDMKYLGPSALNFMNIEVHIPHRILGSDEKLVDIYPPKVEMGGQTFSCSSDLKGIFFHDPQSTNASDIFDSFPSALHRLRRSLETKSRQSVAISCANSRKIECVTISCKVGPIGKNSNPLVNIPMRVYPQQFRNLTDGESELKFNFISLVQIYSGIPNMDIEGHTFELFTTFDQQEILEKQEPLLWLYIVISVILAVGLLAVIIFLLYKCKFFERKKVTGLTAEVELKLPSEENLMNGEVAETM